MRRHQTQTPMRKCIGCRQSKPKGELLRFTAEGASVIPDENRSNDGRGFYLCRSRTCLELAIRKKSFNRICRTNTDTEQIIKAFEAAEKAPVNN